MAVNRSARWKLLVLLILVTTFITFRWWMRSEPLNSDDLTLFTISANAADGQHWLLTPSQKLEGAIIGHQALRIGLLAVSVPVILLFGPTALSYYLVPLLFALGGFLLTWRVMDRNIEPGWALVFGFFHIGLFAEIHHSSHFLDRKSVV